MLVPGYPIETERLLLRPYADEDLDDLADMRRRPDVVRYLYDDVQDQDQVAGLLERRKKLTAFRKEGDGMVLAVELKEAGRVIGDVSLRWVSEEHRQGDIGFIFNPDFQGKGYAFEAATEMLRIGFEGLGLHRIEGHCDGRNTPSARLMERLGMRLEAHFREREIFKGEWGDEMVYAVLAREWRQRNAG